MGCDIHGVFQKRTPNGWVDVPSQYDQRQHYQLFAVLAGVRNGCGFAGIPTGDPVVPIAAPRGLPDDFAVTDDHHGVSDVAILPTEWRREYARDHPEEPLHVWMGDHSHSWLTANEILSWRPPSVRKIGVMSRGTYEAWDHRSEPDDYCGWISGPGVVVVNEVDRDKPSNWTHVKCQWSQDLGAELSYFFNEVRRLRDLYGEVRFVFGFDS